MAEWIEEGDKAPDFTLAADDGTKVKLSALRGAPIVLYFYPKDDTPGCTKEACGFRDSRAKFARYGAVVLGVSPDGVESHTKFRAKYTLPFRLLSDPDHAVAERYGAWREKTLYGKKFLGIVRSTFVINTSGKVAKVFRSVKPDGHDARVLDVLAGMGRAAQSS